MSPKPKPPSVGCLFISLVVSFEAKGFTFYEVQFIFSFVTSTFDVICKKPLPNPKGQRFMSRFSFKSFIVLAPTFSSLISFELIFVYGMKSGCDFFLVNVDIRLSQNHLLKRPFFPY